MEEFKSDGDTGGTQGCELPPSGSLAAQRIWEPPLPETVQLRDRQVQRWMVRTIRTSQKWKDRQSSIFRERQRGTQGRFISHWYEEWTDWIRWDEVFAFPVKREFEQVTGALWEVSTLHDVIQILLEDPGYFRIYWATVENSVAWENESEVPLRHWYKGGPSTSWVPEFICAKKSANFLRKLAGE